MRSNSVNQIARENKVKFKEIQRTKMEYGYHRDEEERVTKNVKIALIGRGQVFGDDDVTMQRAYQSSLVCSENDSEVYLMPRSEFFRTFRQNPDVWKRVADLIKHKQQYYL